MADRRSADRTAVLALAGWTLLVWLGRIRNLVTGDLDGWAFGWRLGAALAFSGAALLVVVGVLARSRFVAPVGSALAVLGSVWWLVRGTGTLLADHSVGFKVVHTVLAVVTIALSWLVLRRRAERPAFARERA